MSPPQNATAVVEVSPEAVEPKVLDPNHARKKDWNLAIEGLRGFSASLVIITHLYAMSVKAGFIQAPPPGVFHEVLTKPGPFGVILFFMISGYLIVQSLIKHGDAVEFLKNRVVRIYPVFLMLHITIFVLGPLAHYDWMANLRHSPVKWVTAFVSNALFLPGILPLPIAQRNAWSLSFEALFYILASLAFVAWMNRSRQPALAALPGLIFAASAAAFLFFYPAASFFFVAGALTYAYTRRPVASFWSNPFVGPIGLACLVFAFFTWQNVTPDLHGWNEMRVADLAKPTLAWCACLICFVTVVTRTGWFGKFLQIQPIPFLGKISYSLYLIHPFVLDGLRAVIEKLSHMAHLPGMIACALFVVAGVPITVFIAQLSYRRVEVAGGRWLAAKLQPHRTSS